MRPGRIMLMQLSSMSYYAVVNIVVQCRGRRRIHHVPAKRDVISCNNVASSIIVYNVQHYANEAARVVQVLNVICTKS